MSRTSIVREAPRLQAAVIVLTAIDHLAETVADAVDAPAAVVVIADAAVVADVPVVADRIVAGSVDLAARGIRPVATHLRGSARIEPKNEKGYDFGRGIFLGWEFELEKQ